MTKITLFLTGIALISVISGCSDKYLKLSKKYSPVSSDGRPNYAELSSWAAHPAKWDPSDSIPKPLRSVKPDQMVDVFYIHPTTHTSKETAGQLNGDLNDAYLNAKTDYSAMLYQASVFNASARVYAPRYRQGHIQQFYASDTAKARQAFELAYADIRSAFQYYLEKENNSRPIIIAGHSQGALMCSLLMKEFFDGKPLQAKLVAAYVIGWPIRNDQFTTIPLCITPTQTGCFCSWRTFKEGYEPPYKKKENGVSIGVTNPISWTTDTTFISRQQNTGSVLYKYNKIYKRTTDAQINGGYLFTKKPRFPGSFLYRTSNYHAGDINLYYMNVRENVRVRVNSFWKR
jgi:hypothetical protein